MIATTRGALLRGVVTEDEYEDEVIDNSDAAMVAGFKDFPMSIIERDATEFDQASNQWRTIRRITGRVPSNVPIVSGDRIKDLRDGGVYAIDGFKRTPRGLSGRASVTIKLRRTTP